MKPILYLCMLLCFFFQACSKEQPESVGPVEPPTSPEPPLRLESIEIVRLPDRLVYPVGYEGGLDLQGLKVEGVYADGGRKELTVTPEQVFGFSAEKKNDRLPVFLRIDEKEAVFHVQVVYGVLDKVEDNGEAVYRVPDYIREIAPDAFAGTHYTEVVLNEGLETIGSRAFMAVPVEKVHFPSTLQRMGERAFYGCSRLKGADLSRTRLVELAEDVFRLSGIGELLLPQTLEVVREMALARTSALKEVHLPSGLKVIESQAFRESGIGSICLPGNIRSIDSQVFMGCRNLERVSCTADEPEHAEGVTGSGIFEACVSLREVMYPASIRRVGSVQFSENPNLERLVLGRNVEEIAFSAFANVTAVQVLEVGAETPPSLDFYSLPEVEKVGEIQVPEKSLELYRAHKEWAVYKGLLVGKP